MVLRPELVSILYADQLVGITVIRPICCTCQLGCFRFSGCSLLLFFLPELVADLGLVRLAPLLVYPLLLPAKLIPILLQGDSSFESFLRFGCRLVLFGIVHEALDKTVRHRCLLTVRYEPTAVKKYHLAVLIALVRTTPSIRFL